MSSYFLSTVSQIVGFLGRYAPFQSAVGECVLASTFFLSCWPAATAKSVAGAATNWLIGSRHSWLVGNLTRYLKVGRAHTMTLGTSTTSIVSPERFSGPDRRPQRLMISRIQACHQSTALQPRLPQPMCLTQLWAGTMVSHGAGDAGKGPWETFRAVAAIAGWSGPATCGLGMGTPFAAVARSAATAAPMEARGATAAPLGILPKEKCGFAVIVTLSAGLGSYWGSYWTKKVLPEGRLSGWSRPMRAIWKVTRLPGLRVSTAIRKGSLMPVRWQRDHELYRRVLEPGRVILLTAWLRASQSAWWSCELSELMRTTPEAILTQRHGMAEPQAPHYRTRFALLHLFLAWTMTSAGLRCCLLSAGQYHQACFVVPAHF